jgi:hypothetical protein
MRLFRELTAAFPRNNDACGVSLLFRQLTKFIRGWIVGVPNAFFKKKYFFSFVTSFLAKINVVQCHELLPLKNWVTACSR